jgi:hypothetical protein
MRSDPAPNRNDQAPKPGTAVIFACTFLVSLSVYGVTLVTEADYGDSAELSLAAWRLGVTHPPGYPVHTMLARLLMLVVPDAALATNLLSALCTSLTVGLMGVMLLRLTRNVFASLTVPIVFALSPRVWSMAVTTEAYNVNLLLLVLSLSLLWRFKETRSGKLLLASAVLFGISMGTYLANALLFPAVAYLLIRSGRGWPARAATFVLGTLPPVLLVLGYSVLRSHALPPIGTEYLPTTIAGALRYFSGQQYESTRLMGPAFYGSRVVAHGFIFLRSYALIGVVPGLIGLAVLWRSNRDLAVFLTTLLAINLGYFTFYPPEDYYTMVAPSYFAFAIAMAFGVAVLLASPRRVVRGAAVVGTVAILAVLFSAQIPDRFRRARSRGVTRFVEDTFRRMPENAVIICDWAKLTPLLYHQTTRGLRPDCTVIERKSFRRYYGRLVVSDYRSCLEQEVPSRPVAIDEVDEGLRSRYETVPLDGTWFEVRPRGR